MAESWEQRERVMELVGEGSTRFIRLTVLFALALSGILLQGLVYWCMQLRRPGESGVSWGCRSGRSPLAPGF